jgi:uncharacterized membrane protein
MYSKVKIAGHPIHPMLIAFPVAFNTAAMVCYMVYNSNADVFWFRVAVAANYAGVIMAVVAALPGFIDWLNIPSVKRAKAVGLRHMLLNVAALALFAINLFIQYPKWNEAQPDASPAILLTIPAFLITLAAGFLGWSMVQKHHIGVSLTPEQQRTEPMEGVNTEQEIPLGGAGTSTMHKT